MCNSNFGQEANNNISLMPWSQETKCRYFISLHFLMLNLSINGYISRPPRCSMTLWIGGFWLRNLRCNYKELKVALSFLQNTLWRDVVLCLKGSQRWSWTGPFTTWVETVFKDMINCLFNEDFMVLCIVLLFCLVLFCMFFYWAVCICTKGPSKDECCKLA